MSNVDEVEKVEKDGLRLTITYDMDGINPRDNDGNMVHMVCFMSSYNIGDKHHYHMEDFGSWSELEARLRRDYDIVEIRPMYAYMHGGITISTSNQYPYNDRWDAGQIGFAFIDKATIRANYGVKHVAKKQIARAVAEFDGEIETYDEYLRGEVFFYSIERVKPCGCCGSEVVEHLESCGGFIGRDWKTNGLIDNIGEEYRSLVEAL